MNLTLTFLLLLSSVLSFGQTFEGYSTDENKSYHCLLQIKPDSSVVFTYDRDKNGIYAEYVGEIEKLTDSTFKVKATLAIGQYYMKSYNKDTLYIKLDSQIARTLDKIQVEYSNKKNRKQLQGYDSQGQPISLLKVPVDKELFNSNKGTDYVEITVNRKNRITGEWVSFTIPFGSAASITAGEKIEFEVKLDGEIIESIGQRLIQTGHIKLKKK
ncbi:hypothetical protein LVD17_00075 [Fulvivirga ulvae]|uniref:hypothetical protein n=1 Tax=Fulvivirga ulvae TaxID=2904245 RepID=UPI001F1DD8D3|nr:hypothetical protein [Fulvivirga ulvae]UII32199.1 hypothetical protein LVD17_28340 [Fulvivirga ulvae]UII32232.1 hypothetical protein LVD17_00075 [Fulvivirga ulvae]